MLSELKSGLNALMCPYCQTDTGGNHAWDCPNNQHKAIQTSEIDWNRYSMPHGAGIVSAVVLDEWRQCEKALESLLVKIKAMKEVVEYSRTIKDAMLNGGIAAMDDAALNALMGMVQALNSLDELEANQ